jgi:hypothetical protein
MKFKILPSDTLLPFYPTSLSKKIIYTTQQQFKFSMKRLFYSFVILILVTGCSNSMRQPFTSTANPAYIRKVSMIPSFNSIKVLYANRDEVRDINPYEEVKDYSDRAVKHFLDMYKVNYDDLSMNREEEEIVLSEIAKYMVELDLRDPERKIFRGPDFNTSITRKLFTNIKMSDRVAKIITDNNSRFAMTTITYGFTRSEANETNRKVGNVAKYIAGAGFAALTGGFGLFFRGVKYQSTTYIILLDAEKKEIAMYNKKVGEIDPVDKASLQEQIIVGMEEYWYKHSKKVNKGLFKD